MMVSVLVISDNASAKAPPISRHDGFLLLWNSIARSSADVNEKQFTDIPKSDPGYFQIKHAKDRGIVDDGTEFRPNAPLDFGTAMLWLFRTRSVEPLDPKHALTDPALIQAKDVDPLLEKYALASQEPTMPITQELLLHYTQQLDGKLQAEDHEVSLYSEKFQGKGTAFGEAFDMNALTAAHRSFPYNTLVKVTNVASGKSVVVRINDRGPFLHGRDMDLSLAAFTTIADRSAGKIMATFERLGDVNLVSQCHDERYQRRITKDVVLTPGVPHWLALGQSVNLKSSAYFAVNAVIYPDGTSADVPRWIGPDETFSLTPSVVGTYQFVLRDTLNHRRVMTMEVVECD